MLIQQFGSYCMFFQYLPPCFGETALVEGKTTAAPQTAVSVCDIVVWLIKRTP